MVAGPVSKRRFSRRAVRQATIIGVVALLALVVLTGGWYLVRAGAESRAEAARQEREATAARLADAVAAPFRKVRGDLSRLARDKGTVALFKQGEQAALDAEASHRTGTFPRALRLRFLRPGQYELDSHSDPPLSFVSLDLLRRAQESAGPVGAEVHLFGRPGQHIALVDTVKNTGGEVIGLLHLSLDTSLLQEALSGVSPGDGYLELRQPSGAQAAVLGSAGGPKGAGEPVIVSVTDTRWNVAYWPAGGALTGGAAGAANYLYLIVIMGLILAAAGAGIFLVRRRGGMEAADRGSSDVVYAGAVKAIMEGAHPGMEQLVPDLPRLGQTRDIRPVSAGMPGDDITRIAKPEAPAGSRASSPRPRPATERPAQPSPPAPAEEAAGSVEIPEDIFRAYDIRGVVGKTLTPEIVTRIGQAIGSEAAARDVKAVVVGRDGRKSSPDLASALIAGLRAAGRDVIDVGMVPTPLLYFAAHEFGTLSGVMITGSHNPPDYNGLKIILGGETLAEEAIRAIRERIVADNLEKGAGGLKSAEVNAEYIMKVSQDIPVALGGALKLVVDCGNGVAGAVAPQLLRALGHDVIELYCDVDGSFPNHHPDPSQPENLQDLIQKVRSENADLGIAFDGDGDRLGVVDGEGNIIWPDRQMMLLAQDVLSRNPGAPIIFDVKCSRHLSAAIEAAGGKPLMWRTGHSLIKKKMKETNSPLAGEMSGHIFFKERWYGFDDGLYAAGRLLEILVRMKKKPAEVFAAQPQGVSTPELRIDLPEAAHRSFMQALKEKLSFDGARIIDVDGYRVEFSDGWGLIRPSNTSPVLVLRFEADNDAALRRIQDAFRDVLRSIQPDLPLPF